MSRQDVEALRRVYARWCRGDFSDVEIFATDVEVTWSSKALDTVGTSRGIDELATNLRRLFESFEDLRFEPEQFVDLGEQVLVIVTVRARGRESGIEVEDRYGHLWTLRGGKAIRCDDADPDYAQRLLRAAEHAAEHLGR
jgi:ketosteroid isomerase-like protein